MADRWLLEDGSGIWLLEDDSGAWLLEDPLLELAAFEVADWTSTANPKTVVVPCQVGDKLFVLGGSAHTGGAQVTAIATSTTSGTTTAWTEPQENFNSPTNEPWITSAVAEVTAVDGSGNVTVQMDPTKSATTMWGFIVLRARNSQGVGVSGFVDASSTQVISLTVAEDSAVLYGCFDWSVTNGTGWTPTADVTQVERSQPGANYAVDIAYWENQAAGTRNYGTTGATGTLRKSIALEILGPVTTPSVTASPITASLTIVPATIVPGITASPLTASLSIVAAGVVPNVAASPLALTASIVAATVSVPAPSVSASPIGLSLTIVPATIVPQIPASPLSTALAIVPATIVPKLTASPLGLSLGLVGAGVVPRVQADPLGLTLSLVGAGVVPRVAASPLGLGLSIISAGVVPGVTASPLGLTLGLVSATIRPVLVASPLGLTLGVVPVTLVPKLTASPLGLSLEIVSAGLSGPGLVPNVAASPLQLSLGLVPVTVVPKLTASPLGLSLAVVPATLRPILVAAPLGLSLSVVGAVVRANVVAVPLDLGLAIVGAEILYVRNVQADQLVMVLELVPAGILTGPVRARSVGVQLGGWRPEDGPGIGRVRGSVALRASQGLPGPLGSGTADTELGRS
jgi:hypothetical protein